MISSPIQRMCSAMLLLLCTASMIHAQQKGHPFAGQKLKTRVAVSLSPDAEETIIDGSMQRQSMFRSAPLFNITGSTHKSVFVQGSHVPVWIETRSLEGNALSRLPASNPLQECYNYLHNISHLTKVKDPANEFELVSVQRSEGGLHTRLKQKHHGIPIEGNEIGIHFTGKGKTLNGRYIPTPATAAIAPSVAPEQAAAIAVQDLQKNTGYRELTDREKELLHYPGPSAKLVYLPGAVSSVDLKLAWKVEVRPDLINHWVFFIDAISGSILSKSNHSCTISQKTVSTAPDLNGSTRTFNTYMIDNIYYMIDASKPMFKDTASDMPKDPVGAIWTIDANNTDGTTFKQITSTSVNSWSAKAVSAHCNADSAYEYYLKVHGRNSLDGKGGTIISMINVTNGGMQMDNAYWNGIFMAYGNGKDLFKPLAGSLDVAAHEMTHGVIQNSANLNYQGQSGAINESLADIFGCMVDREDWYMGEDVMQASAIDYPSGHLRDLSDPHNGSLSSGSYAWQPKVMSEYVFTGSDNGGVHTNSGIPNYAFYQFATTVNVGKDIAEKVYYHALVNYLTASSQFIDLRLAVIQSAEDLYPSNTVIADAARAAFDLVGIKDGNGTAINNNLPVNPGTDYIMIVNTDESDDNTLYKLSGYNRAGGVAPTYTAISLRKVINKPSITDNGSTAYFIDDNGRIIRKSLINNAEIVFDDSRVWDNVAVSKDGTKLAAVTDLIDSSIYVRPLTVTSWTKFKLYNPTYTPGIRTAGPIFADAIEWSHSGESILYDCYNRTVGINEDTIEYWNIGLIDVWDNGAAGFSDGTIKNLFDALPPHVDIGNPTFAKNSSNIVAFDMFDRDAFEVHIIGTNTETGETGLLVEADIMMSGYPTYSKEDDEIAFTSFDDKGDTSVFTIDIMPDKINMDAGSTYLGISPQSKMPVWYATGSRILGTSDPSFVQSVLDAYPNPFTGEVSLNMNLQSAGDLSIALFDMLGQQIRILYAGEESQGEHTYHFLLNDLNEGTYIIKATTDRESGVIKVIRSK